MGFLPKKNLNLGIFMLFLAILTLGVGERGLAQETDYTAAGLAKLKNGNARGAVADFSLALQQKNTDPTTFLNLCVARTVLKEFAAAEENCTQALQLQPRYAEAYLNRGIIRSEQKNTEGAVADFNQAIALNPKLTAAYYNRALESTPQTNPQIILQDLGTVITLDPNFAAAYYLRGSLLARLGDRKGATGDLRRATQLFKQQGNTQALQQAQQRLNTVQ